MNKKALITGITGQDGSYLAEWLLNLGYTVHGLVRRSSSANLHRITHLNSLVLHEGDLADGSSLEKMISEIQPNEVYNLAAMSDVASSFRLPEYTADINGVGVLRLLEAIRKHTPTARFYQASTSEMYGRVTTTPQNERTSFHPRSPYGISKLHAYWTVINYRDAYNLYACNGILFNHESPRRGEKFVSRKITRAVARIHAGLDQILYLGNLNAQRDWGYAPDFVEGMWRMLQQPTPKDFVLATGVTTTVRKFVEMAFSCIGTPITWEGADLQEKGYDQKTGELRVAVLPELFRPAEVDLLIGDASLAEAELNWTPKTHLSKLIQLMVEADLLLT